MNLNLIRDPRRRAGLRAALTRKTNRAIEFAKRSKAAHKAWDTRAALTRKTKREIDFARRSKAAHKAWDTRAWNDFVAGK